MSFGFELTGAYRCLAGLDNYEQALETFYFNHPSAAENTPLRRPVDLGAIQPEEVADALGESPDVIVGGPPCQGFSVAGPRTESDDRRVHVKKFQDFVFTLRPQAFVMENVSGLLVTAQSRRGELLEELLDGYREAGYSVAWSVLNSAHYRVPQQRKRLFIVGIAGEEMPFEFPESTSGKQATLFEPGEPFVTVSEALDDLPSPIEDDPQPYNGPPSSWFQRYLRTGSNCLQAHRPTRHSPEMTERLRRQAIGTRLYPDWNHSWYKLDPARPSPAVKENHRAPFVHHREPRSTSPRECARLQSFPDRYHILGTKTDQLIQIGNAVPPLLAAAIASELAKRLGYKPIQLPSPLSASPA